MQESYQEVESVQNDNLQSAEEQTLSSTTVAVPSTKEKSKDFNASLNVTGIAMLAIFGFMFIFYLIIKGIDRFFPYKPGK